MKKIKHYNVGKNNPMFRKIGGNYKDGRTKIK